MSVQKSRINKEEKEKKTPIHSKKNTTAVYDRRNHNSKDAVQYWIDFSTNPQRPEDVRQHMLTPSLRDQICVSYICQYHQMSSEFIEELIALSTDLFDYSTYTEENIKIVLDVAHCLTKEEAAKLLDKYKKENPYNLFIQSITAVNSRIDWFNIAKHQNIEPWFKEKWGEHFKAHLSASSRTEMSTWINQ